jgi:hypothetical protein
LFAYAGLQVGNTRLTDVDVMALAIAAGGLILRGDDASVATRLRRYGFDLPLLIDPAAYFKAADAAQLSLLDLEPGDRWLSLQAEQRVGAYLSPSLFVHAGDLAGLGTVLTAGQQFVRRTRGLQHAAPAMITLPLDARWFGPKHLEKLCVAAGGVEAPIALMAGGQMDPLDSAPLVRGLVEFLGRLPQPVALLRTDLAGLGAVAHGASAAAIGTSGTLRHVVQPGKRAVPQQDPTPRVLVEPLLSWIRGSQLEQVERHEGLLDCNCAICYGRSVRRFGNPEPASVREATMHSVLVWRAVADRVLSSSTRARAARWVQACEDALELHDRLRAISQVDLWVPAYLKSWAALR